MRVCGAQMIALAAADAVGVLTDEDAKELSALLLHVPVSRVRYSASLSQPQYLNSQGHCENKGHACLKGLDTDAASSYNKLDNAKDLNLHDHNRRHSEIRAKRRRLLYVGSCHAANIGTLRWLLQDVMPELLDLLQLKMLQSNKKNLAQEPEGGREYGSGVLDTLLMSKKKVDSCESCDEFEKQEPEYLQESDIGMGSVQQSRLEIEAKELLEFAVVGSISPSICSMNVCEGGLCSPGVKQGRALIKPHFIGYVESLEDEMRSSHVYIAPRLSGLGQSTKVMLGLEYGVPTVTTPHGALG